MVHLLFNWIFNPAQERMQKKRTQPNWFQVLSVQLPWEYYIFEERKREKKKSSDFFDTWRKKPVRYK